MSPLISLAVVLIIVLFCTSSSLSLSWRLKYDVCIQNISCHNIMDTFNCQLCPRYEGQLTRMAEPIPPSGQSSSYSLTTVSSSSSTDRSAETDRMFITTRIAVAHHFSCRLRRRESCILGATSSQPTLPLHELPPARLVIHDRPLPMNDVSGR